MWNENGECSKVTQSAVIPLTLMKGVLLKELYLLSLPIIKIYNYDIKWYKIMKTARRNNITPGSLLFRAAAMQGDCDSGGWEAHL